LTLKGSSIAGAGTKIEPTSSASTDAIDFDSPSKTPTIAIILVKNTNNVKIENFSINGTGASGAVTGCAPDFDGILFQTASGTIQNNNITGVQLSPSLFGCQVGLGILVQTNPGVSNSSTVNIKSNIVQGYDKNGITCNDAQTTCKLNNNLVIGIGPTPLIAQNGVQFGFGAGGSIINNTVSGDSYDAAGNTGNYQTATAQSCAILIYNTSSPISVNQNIEGNSDIGICLVGTSTVPTPAVTVNQNNLGNPSAGGANFDYGITVDSTNANLHNNVVAGSPVGIMAITADGAVSGASLSNYDITVGNVGNSFSGVAVPLQSLIATQPYVAVITPP